MVWSSIPWNWVIPLIVLLVLLLFSIGLACFCKFGRRTPPVPEDAKVVLHSIDSVEVISNPTCATVFVPAGRAAAGAVDVAPDADGVDLGLGAGARSPRRSAKSKTTATATTTSRASRRRVDGDAFTDPEADISLVPMDLRSSVCREYHNALEMEHDVTTETSESAPMIPSKKK